MPAKKQIEVASGFGGLAALSVLAYVMAFLLRFDGWPTPDYASVLYATVGWVFLIKAAAILVARLHQEYTRYVTFRDMLNIGRTVTMSTIGITLVDSLLLSHVTIPRSVVLLDWGASLLMLAAVRTIPRLIHDNNWSSLTKQTKKTALIVDANDAGEALLRSLRQSRELQYQPIGFVDNRVSVVGRRIAGVPVLGTHADIARIAEKYDVEEVLLTAGALPGKQVRALIELADAHQFRVKVLPSYEQLLEEQVSINPRSVAISDLLRRPSVELDNNSIRKWIRGRTVLVTGSAGSIGSEICRQLLSQSPAKIIVVDRSETGQFFLERELHRLAPEIEIAVTLADLTDRDRLASVFAEHKPDVIFHAAAYKHVPLMEAHVGEAIKNIVLATRNVVDLAEEFRAEGFVMISTDKAVNPTSVMGSCKRLAEQYVQAKAATSSCRLVTVRFGNVLDSAGSVVPIFREQIERGGPVTVTHPNMIRYFMLIPEAAQLVIQASAMGKGGEIFVLDMGEPVRIIDLAADMIRLSGLRVEEDIEIEITGLRPGEKLYEELYSDYEEHQPTQHAKIMVADAEPRNLLHVLNDIRRLSDVLDEPNDLVQNELQEIIPIQTTKEARVPRMLKSA
ncbi:MAG: nucleoside-diphosphate sugar epimerase/dehydratase [Planctomycetota bacterium]